MFIIKVVIMHIFQLFECNIFFFTSDAIDISCLVCSSFYANKITYLSFIGVSLQTLDTILHWQIKESTIRKTLTLSKLRPYRKSCFKIIRRIRGKYEQYIRPRNFYITPAQQRVIIVIISARM